MSNSKSENLDTPEITYYGLSTEFTAILQFPQFLEAVENHGYELVDGEGSPVTTDQVEWLTVVDPETESELPIIIDDDVTGPVELEGFRDVLRAVDEFLKFAHGSRVFMMPDVGDITEDDAEYYWEFDFDLGGYVNPYVSPEGVKKINRTKPEPDTFSEVFGMSVYEYIEKMIQ